MPRNYLQHGARHRPEGTDPIAGFGIANDWCYATDSLGTVAAGTPTNGAFSSITYQTDDGSIFAVDTSGAIDAIGMLVVGTYLVRAIATFPGGLTGTVQLQGVIGGDVTTYDYSTAVGGTTFTDIGPGVVYWEQLCVVNDLTAAAGAYISFAQNTGASRVCTGGIQIFRLT
jgi:hypothetical protein